MLTEKFLTSGILVHKAEDDADLLIVNTTIRNTDDNIQVVVIGEDIDLLILLLTLSPPNSFLQILSLSLFKTSPKGYRFLSSVFALPSSSTLNSM